jgi:hypothetical protein
MKDKLSPSVWGEFGGSEFGGSTISGLSVRIVAGYREVPETRDLLVAQARYVPNTQFLGIPFRSELIHQLPKPHVFRGQPIKE